MTPEELNTELGNIDLFILDQILKGRFKPDMRILDAGCGEGRNLLYFLKNGYKVFALDKDPTAIQMVRMHARTLKSDLSPADHFITGNLSHLPFSNQFFDVIYCSSVLHFASSRFEFEKMADELIRVIHDDGILLIKMDALFGKEDEAKLIGDGIYSTSDGSQRFLLDKGILNWLTEERSLEFLEPVQYQNFDNKSVALLVFTKK